MKSTSKTSQHSEPRESAGRVIKLKNTEKKPNERSYSQTASGILIGGIAGMLGGPVSAVAGMAIGALMGNKADLDLNKENDTQ